MTTFFQSLKRNYFFIFLSLYVSLYLFLYLCFPVFLFHPVSLIRISRSFFIFFFLFSSCSFASLLFPFPYLFLLFSFSSFYLLYSNSVCSKVFCLTPYSCILLSSLFYILLLIFQSIKQNVIWVISQRITVRFILLSLWAPPDFLQLISLTIYCD